MNFCIKLNLCQVGKKRKDPCKSKIFHSYFLIIQESQMNKSLEEKLKTEILNSPISEDDGIPILLNNKFISGDNQKYMKMYNWM